MNKPIKILLSVVVVIALLIAGAVILFNVTFPRVGPAPDLTIRSTPEMVERGRVLAVQANCISCHSERDWSRYCAPVKAGTEGMGGDLFLGEHGKLYGKNITPAALGDWTDGEIYRAITAGLSKDDTPLFPVMPYTNFGKMADEDIHAIIAYLRTMPSIENEVPDRELVPPLNVIVKVMPTEGTPAASRPEPGDPGYGEYLVAQASCNDCHTPMEKGRRIEGMEFAGGFRADMPDGSFRITPNITPDEETGIGYWDRETFIERFTDLDENDWIVLPGGVPNTPMPWPVYSQYSEEDLGAIYDYLRSIPAVVNDAGD